MIWLLGSLLTWAGPNQDAKAIIQSESGWTVVDTVSRGGVDNITLRHQESNGVDCLEASTVTTLPVETMKAIVLDIRANPEWSSAELLSSEVLSEANGRIDYVQVLGMPRPFSPRFWFLRGQVSAGSTWTFAWERLDAAQHYPDALASLQRTHTDPVEVTVNVGSWSFQSASGGTLMRFRSCTNAGGSVPRWAGERAAQAMLPNNIVDLVNATQRRR